MSIKHKSSRYKNESPKKVGGENFTPTELAEFVADRLIECSTLPNNSINILEPSVGDGELLLALLRKLTKSQLTRTNVTAYDISNESLSVAKRRVGHEFPSVQVEYISQDFLETYRGSGSLFDEPNSSYDLIISNPPYVRTQILGANATAELSRKFGLNGRVDLFQPFLVAMIAQLKDTGSLGVIVSNRFLSTKAGASTRMYFAEHLTLKEIWDLGDSKLFDAAVLPALIFGSGTATRKHKNLVSFTSVYETKKNIDSCSEYFFKALGDGKAELASSDNGNTYRINRGFLDLSRVNSEDVWVVSHPEASDWLDVVKRSTAFTFKDVAQIKVGIKTTADKVFIRQNWDDIEGLKPELIRPLLTRKSAAKYIPTKELREIDKREILYPYDLNSHSRKPVILDEFPNAARYLLSHKSTLSARQYVIDAGREWYEIWVPHDPKGWSRTKLVFPDISEKPLFWLDTSGALVSGECYWLVLKEGVPEDMLLLLMAVANSSFIERFYDTSFNNKLYSGKRRFISQYVERFPVPDPTSKASIQIVAEVKKLLAAKDKSAVDEIANGLDELVEKSFGL